MELVIRSESETIELRAWEVGELGVVSREGGGMRS